MTGGIICAGNWIVDVLHSIDRWPEKSDLVHITSQTEGVGGGAANVAIDIAAMQTGLPVFAAGLVGQDRHGALVLQSCRDAGIDTRYLSTTAAATTAHTHVMSVPGESRTFFYHAGTNDQFGKDHVPLNELAATGARIFYLGYLNLLARMQAIGPDGQSCGAELLARARGLGLVTCVDLVSSNAPDFAAVVAATLPQIDYLFLNEVEAARATGTAVAGPDDRAGLTKAALALLAGGVGRAVVIHSARLALWAGKDGALHILPAPVLRPEQIVSPVGAGDAFCAGVLLGLHEGWSAPLAMDLGHRAATASLAVATATGGVPPLKVLMPAHPPLGV